MYVSFSTFIDDLPVQVEAHIGWDKDSGAWGSQEIAWIDQLSVFSNSTEIHPTPAVFERLCQEALEHG